MSVKVTPKPKFKLQGCDFASLKPGDYLLHDDELCIKLESSSQEAINVVTGEIYYDMCGFYVRPVDVVITWKRAD